MRGMGSGSQLPSALTLPPVPVSPLSQEGLSFPATPQPAQPHVRSDTFPAPYTGTRCVLCLAVRVPERGQAAPTRCSRCTAQTQPDTVLGDRLQPTPLQQGLEQRSQQDVPASPSCPGVL